jgi:putative cell wall-binding protein
MMRIYSRGAVVLVALALALSVLGVAGAQEVSDTLTIVKEDETSVSNAELATRLSEETFQTAGTVLIGRDDEFADAMTSGLLQADSPLLLVPQAGPVPQRVLDELAELNPAQVLLLGGVDAILPAVQEELEALGYAVDRAAGPSRFETATEIADLGAADVDTVLVARAFPSEGAEDPTQAFADAMAAGGWAADERWPILLTQTQVLTGTTRDWLLDRGIQQAFILGGTAAVSEAVEEELATLVGTVERVAGGDRFSTAIEIAEKRGAASAADVGRVTLVEGQGEDAWAGGFSSAAHSAEFDAPIVLSNGGELPQATVDWLGGEPTTFARADFAQAGDPDGDGIRLTCVTPFPACQEARETMELPDPVTVGFDPASGSEVQQGASVAVSIDGEAESFTVSGDCLTAPVQGTPPSTSVTIEAEPGESCTLTVVVTLPGGSTQEQSTATYTVTPPPAEPTPVDSGGHTPTTANDVIALVDEPAPSGSPEPRSLRVIDAGGTDERIVDAFCDDCEGLRVDRAGNRVVYVQVGDGSDELFLRSGQVFTDLDHLNAGSTASFEYENPQFTPDGTSVVVTRIDGSDRDVVTYSTSGGSPVDGTVVVADHGLAGPDAVGPPAGGASADAPVALVVQEPAASVLVSGPGFASLPPGALFIADLDTSTADAPAGLESSTSVTSAALSPNGAYYAYDDGANNQLGVGNVATSRLIGLFDYTFVATSFSLPVWSDGTRVHGIATDGTTNTLVSALVISTSSATFDTTAAGGRAPVRPGVIGTRDLIGMAPGAAEGQLVHVPGGSPLVTFHNASDVVNPHIVPPKGALPPVT